MSIQVVKLDGPARENLELAVDLAVLHDDTIEIEYSENEKLVFTIDSLNGTISGWIEDVTQED